MYSKKTPALTTVCWWCQLFTKDSLRRWLTQRLLRFGKVEEGFPEREGIHALGCVGGLEEGNVCQESYYLFVNVYNAFFFLL